MHKAHGAVDERIAQRRERAQATQIDDNVHRGDSEAGTQRHNMREPDQIQAQRAVFIQQQPSDERHAAYGQHHRRL